MTMSNLTGIISFLTTAVLYEEENPKHLNCQRFNMGWIEWRLFHDNGSSLFFREPLLYSSLCPSVHEFRSVISIVFSLLICKSVILTLECSREVFWELLNKCLHCLFRAYQSNNISIKLFYWKKSYKVISGLAARKKPKPYCFFPNLFSA